MLDIIGRKFGRLVVEKFIKTDKHYNYLFEAKCGCGKTSFVYKHNLIRGLTKSCGCLSKEVSTTHGMKYTPEYSAWSRMFVRCYNKKYHGRKYYGGRGITVCDRWNRFENFIADMGKRPRYHSLDRIDNDKGYSPENCRWATVMQQRHNQRRCTIK